jgi:hypothetical protein
MYVSFDRLIRRHWMRAGRKEKNMNLRTSALIYMMQRTVSYKMALPTFLLLSVLVATFTNKNLFRKTRLDKNVRSSKHLCESVVHRVRCLLVSLAQNAQQMKDLDLCTVKIYKYKTFSIISYIVMEYNPLFFMVMKHQSKVIKT